jgi:hypothetical protein
MNLLSAYPLAMNHVLGGGIGVALVLGIAVVLRRREADEHK